MRSKLVFGAMAYVSKPLSAYQARLEGNPHTTQTEYSHTGNDE